MNPLKVAHKKEQKEYDEETRLLAAEIARELEVAWWRKACKKYNKPVPPEYVDYTKETA